MSNPPIFATFLLRSAFLEEFDAALCEAVFGVGVDWASLIARAVQANLFILTFSEGTGWYRYNPLFQRFLQETFARESPGEASGLLDDLGVVYRSQNNWEKAYAVYQRRGQHDALGDLIEEAFPALARDGHLITLSTWFDALPKELLRKRPALASLNGIIQVMLGEVEGGLELLDFAVSRFRQQEESEKLAISLTRRTLAFIFRGDFSGALKDAAEAYKLSETQDDLVHVQADSLRSMGISLINLDRNMEAGASLNEALNLYQKLEDPNKGALTHIDLGFSSSNLGLYSDALRHYELALQHWENQKNLVHQATVLNNIGVLLHIRGEILPASQRFEEALAYARRSGYRRAESLTLASLGDLYSDLDDLDAALEAYRQAREIAQEAELESLILYLDLAETMVACRKGDEYLATELLALVKKRLIKSESDYERGLYGFRAGQLYLLHHDYSEAVSELTKAAQLFDRGGRQAELAQSYMLLAEATYQAGSLEHAAAYVEQALGTASALESDFLLLTTARFAKGILGAISQHGDSDRDSERLLRRVLLYEEQLGSNRRLLRRQVSLVPVSPPHISVRALGDGVVVRNGKKIDRCGMADLTRSGYVFLLARPSRWADKRKGWSNFLARDFDEANAGQV